MTIKREEVAARIEYTMAAQKTEIQQIKGGRENTSMSLEGETLEMKESSGPLTTRRWMERSTDQES